MAAYETVIGVEVHIELLTASKIFCGCSAAFGGAPNTHTCPVCTGMPGSLPVLNKRAVDLALAVGLASGCSVNKRTRFDRKNYFYPDNPQNYQISQLYAPICHDGAVETDTGSGKKTVRIHELHMEEDAGKLIHNENGRLSYIDYNRSGVPLIEIVSEPDMNSAEEVIAFLEQLKIIAQYTGASDCRMQEGSMRVDVNLSVRKAGQELGTRTEMKNLNSFRAVSKAIEKEAERQIAVLDSGGKVVRETRRWDDAKEMSFPMRSKEDINDYRYFPDPDLPVLEIGDEWIERIRSTLPELRDEKCARYIRELSLPEYDASMITGTKRLADLFEETVAAGADPKKASNWIMGETLRLARERMTDPSDIVFSAAHLASIIRMVQDRKITGITAKEVFERVFDDDIDPEKYIDEHGLGIVNDSGALRAAAGKVIKDNPKAVNEFLSGKEKAIGFLIGQVMREMKGKADPSETESLIRKLIDKEN